MERKKDLSRWHRVASTKDRNGISNLLVNVTFCSKKEKHRRSEPETYHRLWMSQNENKV